MSEEIVAADARKRRPKSSERQMAEWASRFHQSGLSQAEFARQHGLAATTLQRWVAEHPRVGPPQDSSSQSSTVVPTFAELNVGALVTPCSWAAELSRPNGMVLRVGANVPPTLLEQLLRVC